MFKEKKRILFFSPKPHRQLTAKKHRKKTMSQQKTSPARVFSTVDYTKFVHKEPRRNNNGGFNSFIDLDANTKETPRIQWAECTAKFGLSDPVEGSTRRNLELSVQNQDMLEWIRGNDQCNISHVSKNSQTFFKKDLSEEVLGQTLYRWSAPDHAEKKYEPLWRVKVVMSGKSKTNFFRVEEEVNNETGEKENVIVPCDSTVLTPWCKVLPITTLGGLWFVSKGFGTTFVCTDLLVWPAEKKRKGDFVGLNMRMKKPKTDDNNNGESDDGPAPYNPEGGDTDDLV